MQEIRLQKLNTDSELYSETKISQELVAHMKLSDGLHQEEEDDDEGYHDAVEEEEGEGYHDEEEEEEEFSFMFEGTNESSIAAEDATDGHIMPVFPLFNRDLFFSGEDLKSLHENLPMRLPVKKVFVETNEGGDEGHHMTSVTSGSDEIAGPYCEWSMKKAVEASSSSCKKSNSTGFSRIWRLKDIIGRSNSDGKDAFVFLNNSHNPPSKAEVVTVTAIAKENGEKRRTTNGGRDHGLPPKEEPPVKVGGQVKKSGRSKTVPLSAHEVYLKSKAKDEEKHRTYLPYRPELMGFFTNSQIGLTKNVHPY